MHEDAHRPNSNGGSAVAEPGFGIYIHWPFCLSKCPYCDFNSHVAADIDIAAWQRAMLRALDWFAEHSADHVVTSVFFGGGTPSLMPPRLVQALLEHIARRWRLDQAVEITLEANPTSAEQENFAAFAAAGVNRLSLGVQALDDAALRALGRTHTADQARRAWELARRTFARASFDLIYARPGQTPSAWAAELDEALRMAPDHLSAYQLTMEPETPFFRLHQRGRLRLPDEAASVAMLRLTRQRLAAAGLQVYEVSSHARPGAECRHNLLYWRYGPYAGIGPGAHARLPSSAAADGEDGRRLALTTLRRPRDWLAAVLGGKDGHPAGLAETERLSAQAVATEYLLMSLRTREGADLHRLHGLSGMLPAAECIEMLRQQGLLRCVNARGRVRLITTEAGELVLEALLAELTSALRPSAAPPATTGLPTLPAPAGTAAAG